MLFPQSVSAVVRVSRIGNATLPLVRRSPAHGKVERHIFFWATPVLCLIIVARLTWLFDTPLAVGRDAYYYVLQTTSILEHGRLYYPTHSPGVLYIAAALALTGLHPIVVVKALAICCAALVPLLVFAVLVRLTPPAVAAAGAVLTAASSLVNYFAVEFVAQLTAIVCLLGAVRCSCTQRRHAAVWTALACVAAALTTHKSAIVVLSVVTAGSATFVFVRMLSRMRAVVWAGSALVVQWIFAWLVVLSEGRLATPGWAGLDRHVSTPEILVIAASSPVLVSGLCGVCDEAESPHLARRFAAIVLWVTAIVFVNPWVVYQSQVQGVAERLALWSWPVSGLAFALALHWSSLWKTNRRRVMRVVLVLLAAGVLIHRSPPASSRAYIAERAVVMREIVTVRSCVGAAFPLIVTEHGMQFVVTYSTGLPAVSQPPQASTPVDSAWWFFRVPPRAAAFVDRRFDGCVIGSWALAPKTSMRAWLDTLPPGPKGDVALANPVHIGETFLGVTSVLGPDGFLHLVRSDSAR